MLIGGLLVRGNFYVGTPTWEHGCNGYINSRIARQDILVGTYCLHIGSLILMYLATSSSKSEVDSLLSWSVGWKSSFRNILSGMALFAEAGKAK